MRPIPRGRYRHYKGNDYTVVGTVRHSETHHEMAVYRQEDGEYCLWVRPANMFFETVNVFGQDAPRFRYLRPEKVISPSKVTNLLVKLPTNLSDERVQNILAAASVRMERIISHSHVSPKGFWYDQDQNEWVLVLKRAARLRFEGDQKPFEMKAGDFVNIPAHRRHRVEWTTPNELTLSLAVFYE